MKKFLLFLMFALFCIPWVANAQVELTVCDGMVTNAKIPVNGLYTDTQGTTSEFIFPAEMEGMSEMVGGTISKVTFYISEIPASWGTPTIQLYIGEVAETTLSSLYGPSSFTIVNTSVWSNQQSTIEVEFDVPYTYEGGNLLIGTYVQAAGSYKTTNFYGDEAESGASRYNNGSGAGTAQAFLPKTTFTYEAAATGCDMPTAIAVSDITADGATVTWEGEGNAWNLRYKASTDEEYTLVEGLTSQTYTFEAPLAGNTTYSVGVQTVCDGLTSFFKSTTFKTADACAAPTNLQITDITAESATLTWTSGYQETEWIVKYKKSSDSEYITETVNGTPSITLRDLDGITTYNVQVYNCENYISANFTTAASIPLTEAFAASSAPTGWTRYNTLLTDDVLNGTTALSTYSGGWNFGTSNGVFDNHAKVNIYGSSCKYWLVTPALPMEDNVQLTFDLALTKYSGTLQAIDNTLGEDDRFVVLITTDGGTTWSILREWNNTGSEYVYNDIVCSAIGEAVAIDLSSYAGQSIAVAFYGESTVSESGSDNNLHIDNVSINYIPDCAIPTGLVKTDVTAHEATITWVSDAEAWQVQLNEEDPIDVEETTYTFENLDPETTYSAKVRANCSGTYSEWTTAVSFTTTIACPAPTNLAVAPNALSATFTWQSNAGEWEVAFAADAEADPAENIVGTVNEATYTVNDLELGDYYFWVRANCGELDGYSTWAGPASVHIGYCVPNPTSHDGSGITGVSFGMGDYVVENGGEGTSIPSTSPYYGDYTDMIGAVQAGVESTIAITTATGSWPYTFVIWVDFDNSLSFEDGEIVYIGKASSGAGTHNATITVPADQAVGDYRMRIYGADSYFSSFYNNGDINWDANHDPCVSGSYRHANDYTLRVLEAPSCLIPTDLAIDYTGGTEATISWTSDAEAWNMRVNGVDVNGVITNPYTLSGLELATTYSVEVQANCGEDETSEWTNAVSFTTDLCLPENMCAITLELNDSYGDGWNGGQLSVVDAVTEKAYGTYTIESGSSETFTLAVCDGRDINIVYAAGNYSYENGWVITDINGEVISEHEGGDQSNPPTAGVITTYTVNCAVDPCMIPKDLDASEITSSSANLSWTGHQDAYNLRYRYSTGVSTAPATIILEAHDVWGDLDDSGYQMLLDADATAFGNEIPTSGPYTGSDYSAFEYLIPENAECDGNSENIVFDGSVTLEIPAGVYDWCIVNPEPSSGTMWIAGDGDIAGRFDDYVFAPGVTYHFTMQKFGGGDGAALEIICDWSDWTTVENVTSPYDLTGLNPHVYEWQVQGINEECDGGVSEWSESAIFTTLPNPEEDCNTILVDADNPTWIADFEAEGAAAYTGDLYTGKIPGCWSVPVQYTGASMDQIGEGIDTLPQIYHSFNTTEGGQYSLRMHFRSLLAMPELDENVDLGKVRLSMYVRQSYWRYQLQIGIITDMENPEESFVPVALVNNPDKTKTYFECGFSSVKDLVGAGRYIAFKNIGSNANDPYAVNYLDDVTLTYVNVDNLECQLYPGIVEDFERYTNLNGATGVEPDCWEVIHEDVSLESTTKPQLYRGYNSTDEGHYSLRMKNRCIYAMPEFIEGNQVSDYVMTLKLRQPSNLYRLQVGVVNEEGEFYLVKTLKCSGTSLEQKSVDFTGCTGHGNRIAFRNVLVPGTGMSTDYFDYSYNYIDDINLSAGEEAKSELNAAEELNADIEEIAVYPNPTTGDLYIDAVGVQKVECYNQMGQLVRVYDEVRNSIDLNTLTAGVYTLRITVPQGVTVRKVVKK